MTAEIEQQINETICMLTKQKEVCTSLSVLLSHLSDELAGNITIQYFDVLSGSVIILDTVSKELQTAYSLLGKISDNS
jgi:hypothetical protein